MKHLARQTLLCLFLGNLSFQVIGQKTAGVNEYLSPEQVTKLFPDSIRKDLHIDFPIFRVYHYSDRSGKYYCVFTENQYGIRADDDTIFDKIRAIDLRLDSGGFSLVWEMNDFIDRSQGETSIWFWTKYADFRDINKDSLLEPIIVYGSSGAGSQIKRIKILTYYKGNKVAVRCQFGGMGSDVITVDKAFYDLPAIVEEKVKDKMRVLGGFDNVHYPAGWEDGFKKEQLKISEK